MHKKQSLILSSFFQDSNRFPSNTNSRKLEEGFDSRSKFRQSRFEKKTNQAYQKRLDGIKVAEFQFKRNLTEKEMRMNLFVIKGTACFEALSLREKCVKSHLLMIVNF
ncbi:hypothetical protein EDEG_00128 [Edhazardia aedis USNM 41457]|uniref:Uncharacterized protein n=1 Tax=Edhazardia aedis (strain USNM 41457) TaxID=1003232 RepID=J8ZYZ4_EDHAE|nr:hypothetical protein EDEG_00128 [Edhazardia aedis USNM 41457]|eukprot:EJW04908.1 hypothetical protein EDEG_00128 [Edhazardia aedis USNM 41457]